MTTTLSMPPASPLAGLGLAELVEASRGFTRAQNLAAVDRLDAVFAMVCAATARAQEQERERVANGLPERPGYARLEPARLVRSHVTTAMGAPAWHAGRLVTAAVQLHTRLHRLSRHAREGVFDEALIVDLACRLASIPDRLLDAVEDEVIWGLRHRLDAGDPPSRNTLGEMVDRAVEREDADELDRRHEAARQERRVSFRPRGEGMTSMWATLPTEDAATLAARLQAAADTTAVPGGSAHRRPTPRRRPRGARREHLRRRLRPHR